MARRSIPSLARIFEDTANNRRKLALVLYALVAPPFALTTYLLAVESERRLAALAVLAICLVAFALIAVRNGLRPVDWIFPAAIAPIACCGISSATSGHAGLGFMAATGARVAWAAVLFELPTVVVAVLAACLTCFAVVFHQAGLGAAIGSSAIAAVIHALVAWVAHGKSTAHRSIAKAMRQSEEKFSKAFENNGDAIYIVEIATGHYLEVNQGFERLTGYLRHEVVGRTSRDLQLWVDCGDREQRFVDVNDAWLETLGFARAEAIGKTATELGLLVQPLGKSGLCTDSTIPAKLFGDPRRLRQVLINLLGNAIKFSSQGEVLLETCLVALDDRIATLRFSVIDSGIGIPADRLAGLFQKLTQVDASTPRRFGGTGLGLAISRELVEMMGGKIGVNSELGRGSEFWFTVCLSLVSTQLDQSGVGDALGPKLSEPQCAKAAHFPGVARLANAAPAGHKESAAAAVLVVEDNLTNQMVAHGMLSQLGVPVDIVGNGKAALVVLRRQRYALVLMDVQMPEMDGIEATELIRSGAAGTLDPNVPIVAMTAHVMHEERQRCLDAQMNGQLAKPVTFQRLREVLEIWQVRIPPGDGGPQREAAVASPESLPCFDYDELLGRLMGDSELMTKILDTFLQDVPQRLSKLEQCLQSGDATGGALQSHSLQGAAATVGAKALRHVALEIETNCRHGNAAGALSRLPKLMTQFEALNLALRQRLGGDGAEG